MPRGRLVNVSRIRADATTTGATPSPPGAEHETKLVRRARMRRAATGGPALHLAVVGVATLGLNKVRLGAWTVSDLVFLMTMSVVCFKLLEGRRSDLAPPSMRKTSPAILFGTILLVVAGTVASLQSFYPVESMLMVVRIVWITLAWFWVLRTVSPNRRTLRSLLMGFRFTILASCFAAMAGYFGLVSLTPANNENREAAFLNHPNELGGLLAMALPFVVLGVLQGRGRRAGTMGRRLAFLGLMVVAITTTGSMTAVLSSVVSLVTIGAVTLVTRSKRRRRFRSPAPYFLGVAVVAAGLGWVASSDLPVVNRFTDLGEGGSEVSKSVGTREDINGYILGNLDHYLVSGVGLDANTTNLVEGEATASRVHNLYLKLIYEAGIPGLIGLVIILATAFRQGWRLVLNTRGDDLNALAVALVASLASISFFALFQPLFAQRYYWFPAAFIGVLWALRREEASEAVLRPPVQSADVGAVT